jgi:hypothetical protein
MYLRRDMKHNFEMQLTKFKKYFYLTDEKNKKYFTLEEEMFKNAEQLSVPGLLKKIGNTQGNSQVTN